LLLRAYPGWYRRERAEEMLGTLLEASPPGRSWPSFRDTRGLIIGGLRVRGLCRMARPRRRDGPDPGQVSARRGSVRCQQPSLRSVTGSLDLPVQGVSESASPTPDPASTPLVVDIWAQEFFRQDPLGAELRQRVQAALRTVDGVTGVDEHDNESWQVTGDPSGEALTRAAARVVDDMADRLREG
jgi:hypothetical protein